MNNSSSDFLVVVREGQKLFGETREMVGPSETDLALLRKKRRAAVAIRWSDCKQSVKRSFSGYPEQDMIKKSWVRMSSNIHYVVVVVL